MKAVRTIRLRRSTILRLKAAASVMGISLEELAERRLRTVPPVDVSRAELARRAAAAEDLLDVDDYEARNRELHRLGRLAGKP